MNLQTYLKQRQLLVNRALAKWLPPSQVFPGTIHQAMRYSVLGQGKRIRPILALAASDVVGGNRAQVLPAACALELIHAYSLVHDDLPAMDDDDLRRGKLSCHKKFGEAIGVLTGDALLTYSFSLLARVPGKPNGNAAYRLQVIQEVAQAIGTEGMLGGQVVDVRQGKKTRSPKTMEWINTRKTGALIGASVRVGALLGGASHKKGLTPKAYRALSAYGNRIGLVFQLVDDLLDGDGSVRLYGAQAVQKKAQRLTQSAVKGLTLFGKQAQALAALAQFILTRKV